MSASVPTRVIGRTAATRAGVGKARLYAQREQHASETSRTVTSKRVLPEELSNRVGGVERDQRTAAAQVPWRSEPHRGAF
jgi:hypothetical protein